MMKTTSVKIDSQKWELVKLRGYKLQDLVDTAFTNIIQNEYTDPEEIEELKKMILKQQKQSKNKYKQQTENHNTQLAALQKI
mgnify:FL=1